MRYILVAILGFAPPLMGDDFSHASVMTKLPGQMVERFAAAQKPDKNGAIGRNRKQYLHVRFQYRMHHLADYAVRERSLRAVEYFVRSLEYSFAHQKEDGGFDLHLPADLQGKQVSRGDLASGTAFFLASAGSGILSLKNSEWFQNAVDAAPLRKRLAAFVPKFKKAAAFLSKEKEVLTRYDAKAPNRLLFDALAFHSAGVYLSDDHLIEIGSRFTKLALALHHEDGYFIEGGGHDSSYNGVAVAVGYRLLIFDPKNQHLRDSLGKAVQWQYSRVKKSGEVSVEGNTRVRPGGESFLGKEKQVDVSHTIEGFLLGFATTGQDRFLKVAESVDVFYFKRK